jgi:hypothetical protein
MQVKIKKIKLNKIIKPLAIVCFVILGIFGVKIVQTLAIGDPPVAYWKFDDASGTTAQDNGANNYDGTVSNATWQTEDLCISGKCLYFNGTTASVTVSSTIASVKTVSFWVKSTSGNASLIDLNAANTITATGSAITANGFSSPTIYVNGVAGSTLTANTWQMVTVTTATAINASTIEIGSVGAGFTTGFIDEVRFFDYALSTDQIKTLYAAKSTGRGVSLTTAVNPNITGPISSGLVGYWKLDETSGNATDSSGNGMTGTATGTTVVAGKFGNGRSFTSTDQIAVSSISNVQTIAFWAYPTSTTTDIIRLRSSPATNITAASGTVTATGFSPTIYVNGIASSTVTANSWQHIVMTVSTGITADAILLGQVSAAMSGYLDEVRLYNRVLTSSEVAQLYNWAPGPVGEWRFEEGSGTSADDASGGGNSGTMHHTASRKTGKYGRSAHFDGATTTNGDSHIQLPDNAYDSHAQGSIVFWIRPLDSGDEEQTFFGVAEDTNDVAEDFLSLGYNTSTNSLSLYVMNDGGEVLDASFSISANAWSHVAVLMSSSENAFYLNGSKITPTYSAGTPSTNVWFDDVSENTTAYTIGCVNLNASDTNDCLEGYIYRGEIDEFKIYNYIRTPKQIVEDMNAGHPAPGSPVGSAIVHFKFDELYGNANNSGSGGNSYLGTLTSMSSPASVGLSGWQKAGKFGGAVAFDGTNDLVDFGDLSFTESVGTISASFWVRPNALTTQRCLLCKWNNTAGAASRSWAIETGSANADAILVEISTDGNTGIASAETAAGQLAVGVWTHVAVVLDSSGGSNPANLKVFVNGIQKTLTFSGTIPNLTQANARNARAGASSDTTPARLFSGMIDEIKFYTGALSAAEVLTEYNRASSIQLGSLGTASQSASMQYCIPGDTTACSPPVGEWKFEEGSGSNAYDTSGNGRTGTLNSNVSWVSGKIGKAANFNLANGAIDVGNFFDSSSAFTMSAWIYPTANPDSITLFGNSSWNYSNWWINTDGSVEYCGDSSCSNDVVTVAGAVVLNTWQHVAITYNGNPSPASGFRLYVNGLDVTSDGVGTAADSSMTDYIGSDHVSSPTYEFWGKIDDFRIFDYARTPAQIAWDYNRGLPVTWWKFNECQGTTANDSVGTTSGTLNGGTAGTCTTANAWYNGATGKYNSAGSFGSAPNFTTATSTSTYPYSVIVNNSASWGGWFKPTSSVNSQGLMDKDNTFRLYTNSSGHAICSIYNNGAYDDATSVTAPLSLNAWNHLVCTYDGTNIKTYVNGVLKNTTANTDGISVATSTLRVGQISGGSPNQFTGLADDIKIWNYPLTAVQVKLDYNQASAVRFGPESGSP